MNILKSLEESGLLIKKSKWNNKRETKKQKRGFINILLCILASRLLVNMFAGKGVIRAGERANGAG